MIGLLLMLSQLSCAGELVRAHGTSGRAIQEKNIAETSLSYITPADVFGVDLLILLLLLILIMVLVLDSILSSPHLLLRLVGLVYHQHLVVPIVQLLEHLRVHLPTLPRRLLSLAAFFSLGSVSFGSKSFVGTDIVQETLQLVFQVLCARLRWTRSAPSSHLL